MQPTIYTLTPSTPCATCAKCNLSAPDDGRRFKRHGGKVFICARCKPDRC